MNLDPGLSPRHGIKRARVGRVDAFKCCDRLRMNGAILQGHPTRDGRYPRDCHSFFDPGTVLESLTYRLSHIASRRVMCPAMSRACLVLCGLLVGAGVTRRDRERERAKEV